jgi:hypothetical protein
MSVITPTYGSFQDSHYDRVPIIDDVQLVEGIIASTVFIYFVYVIRYQMKLSYIYYLSFPWFFTWICRKGGSNLYVHLKRKLTGVTKPVVWYW